MKTNPLNSIYKSVRVKSVSGRYVTNVELLTAFKDLGFTNYKILGYSVNQQPIYGFKIGFGQQRVLLWSQMHGNESTTTKAVLDLLSLLLQQNRYAELILQQCTLMIIPILNPDGALQYTRHNANDVDLNRDAQGLSQPESAVLRQVFNTFMPQYCFNLHDQRTIYGVENTGNSATLSFLSPAQNPERSLSDNRKAAMAIITNIYKALQHDLPQGIARYDDSFNLDCVGDTFQNYGVPTLLFEAGHYPNDYKREHTRRFVFMALVEALLAIGSVVVEDDYALYFNIPENKKNFYDLIFRNVKLPNNSVEDVAIQYEEQLEGKTIKFIPKVEVIGDLSHFFGHKTYDVNAQQLILPKNTSLKTGNAIDFVIMNNEKIVLKP